MKLATLLKEKYELVEEISSKERSHISRRTFLAKDIHTQESFIVKTIQPEKSSYAVLESWAATKLFEREAQTLALLDHPAIPRYKDAFEAEIDGCPSLILVQTYINATSLEEIVQSGKRFSVAEVKAIAAKLLQVLIYLHEQSPSVIHRDIKPSNILVSGLSEDTTGNMCLYLIDFGAVHTDLSKESGTITTVGSYGYIPLEQFSGYVTPASDLYSLGMTLIYLITGIHPMDLSYTDGKVQIPNHNLDPAFLQWLERMSAPYLDQRFDSAQQALVSLRSRRSSQGYYLHLKPKGTRISIERDRDCLRVFAIHRRSILPSAVVGLGVTLIFCSSLVLMFVSLLKGLLLLIFAAIFSRYRQPLTRMFSWIPAPEYQYVVEITRVHGIRTSTRKNAQSPITWHSRTSRYADIRLVTYTPGYEHTFNTFKDGDEQITPFGDVLPDLTIHAGNDRYSIGNHQLSPAEFWWLGQEISDFLGLELQIIYPMPSVSVQKESSGCGC